MKINKNVKDEHISGFIVGTIFTIILSALVNILFSKIILERVKEISTLVFIIYLISAILVSTSLINSLAPWLLSKTTKIEKLIEKE